MHTHRHHQLLPYRPSCHCPNCTIPHFCSKMSSVCFYFDSMFLICSVQLIMRRLVCRDSGRREWAAFLTETHNSSPLVAIMTTTLSHNDLFGTQPMSAEISSIGAWSSTIATDACCGRGASQVEAAWISEYAMRCAS